MPREPRRDKKGLVRDSIIDNVTHVIVYTHTPVWGPAVGIQLMIDAVSISLQPLKPENAERIAELLLASAADVRRLQKEASERHQAAAAAARQQDRVESSL